MAFTDPYSSGTPMPTNITTATVVHLTEGDYLELELFQETGGTMIAVRGVLWLSLIANEE